MAHDDQGKTPFTQTSSFEKVRVEQYGDEAYIYVSNGRDSATTTLTLKQVKALRKKLKEIEREAKCLIARRRQQGRSY